MDLALFKSFLDANKPEELKFLDNSSESNWIRSHYQTYGTLPLISTFESHFQVTLPEFTEDWEYYKKNLLDEDFVRQATPILDEFNKKIGKVAAKDSLLWLRDALSGIHGKTVTGKGVSIIRTAPSRIDYYQKKAGVRHPIGLAPYDNLSGGVGEDDIFIIAARPGQGKSMLAISIATEMARQGLKVGLYSSEMTTQAVGARFDSFAGNISNYAITRGREVQYWNDYVESLEDWEGDIIVRTIDDYDGQFATPQDIQAFILEEHLDVLVIDQINGMRLNSTRGLGSEEHVKLAELQKQLTAIQKTQKIPFIEVLQLNRMATGENEPQLEHLAGSGRFEQDASAVLGFWKKSKDVLMCKCMKSRDFEGEGKKWEFNIDFDKGRIMERTDAVGAIRNKLAGNTLKQADGDAEIMD